MVHKAGFVIHSAIHMARPDLKCVIHSHSVAGMAVSAQEQGLLPLTQHAMMFYERVGHHGYESFANLAGSGGAPLRLPDTDAARLTSQHNKDGFTDERFEIVWRACLGMIPEDRRDYRR